MEPRSGGGRLSFRVASQGDIDELVALVESAYHGAASREGWTTEADLLDGQRTDPESLRAVLAREGTVVLVAHEDDAIVACCELDRHGRSQVHFGMFAVRPNLQGGGVGSAVLAHAEELARTRYRASSMRMTVIKQRDELIAWYRRRGYEATGEKEPFPYGDDRFGIPRRDDLEFVVLTKQLVGPR